MGNDKVEETMEAGHTCGEFSYKLVVREVEVLQAGLRREVDGGGVAIVVEAEELKPEPREPCESPSGAGKVEAIENKVGDSAMAAANAEPRPGTWVSRIGPGGKGIELVRIRFEIQQCRKFKVRERKMEEREDKNCLLELSIYLKF